MATNLATLGIKVDPSKAISGANKARKAILRVGKAARSVAGAIGTIGKSFGKLGGIALGAVVALGYFVKKSLNSTDAMAKMSRAIGVSVESLQKLRHAGNLAGMESTQLDKAVQKLAVNMADVAKGTGEAKDIFSKYGIKATDLHGKLRPVEDVMLDVADATSGISNRTEKAELAYRLFGARGGLMINMLNQGSEAMREQWEEAEKLGLVMSEKTAKGVEDANDSIARLSGFLTSSFRRAIAELAPTITEITKGIREWVEMKVKKEKGIGAVAKKMATQVLIAVGVIIDAIEMMGNVFINTMKTIHDLNPFKSTASELTEEITELFALLDDVQGSMGFADGADASIYAANQLLKQIKELNAELKLTNQMEDIEPIDLSSFREHLAGLIMDINTVNNTPIVPKISLGEDDEESFFTKFKIQLEEMGTAFNTQFEDMAGKADSAAKKIGTALGEVFGKGGSLSVGMGNAVADLVVYGKKGEMTWKKLGQSIRHNIISALIEESTQMAINWIKKKAIALWEKATAVSTEAVKTGAAISGQTTRTGVSVTAAATETAAWTPAAIVTSLASFGGNALMAIAGIGAVRALMKSFDGGGFTGNGSRSGGVDGKGGFMAVMHPNETVTDHTKGQTQGQVINVTYAPQVNALDPRTAQNVIAENAPTIVAVVRQAFNRNGQAVAL